MIHSISVYFDGTVGPEEPAKAGSWAFAVFKDDSLVHKESGFIESPSDPLRPMACEYEAAINALGWLLENEMARQHVRLFNDNLDLIKQLSGEWEIPGGLAQAYATTTNLLRKFRDIGFNFITKKKNDFAAEMAEQELKKRDITPLRLTLRARKDLGKSA